MKKARLTGIGIYIPEKVLSNADLEKMVDTNDEWIFTRTGMKERRIASEEETTSFMGAKAAQAALSNASTSVADIELVICATCTPDMPVANTGSLIQKAIGADNAGALEIQAACSGFIYGLSMAKAYIESGMYKTILVVAPEKISSITDYSDRGTCILFGDGASAAVVQDEGEGFRIDTVELGSDGGQVDLLYVPAGGSRLPASSETVEKKKHYLQMEGREVFKHAVRRMEAACNTCLQRANLSEKDISYLVPHQANIRIIEALAKRFNVPMERVFVTIHKYGNTSASSVGIALFELIQQHPISTGERILMPVFGAGLTWAACLLTKVGQ